MTEARKQRSLAAESESDAAAAAAPSGGVASSPDQLSDTDALPTIAEAIPPVEPSRSDAMNASAASEEKAEVPAAAAEPGADNKEVAVAEMRRSTNDDDVCKTEDEIATTTGGETSMIAPQEAPRIMPIASAASDGTLGEEVTIGLTTAAAAHPNEAPPHVDGGSGAQAAPTLSDESALSAQLSERCVSSTPVVQDVAESSAEKQQHANSLHDNTTADEQAARVTYNDDRSGGVAEDGKLETVAASIESHWGTPRSVKLVREAGKSLGISIVGGRVEMFSVRSSTSSRSASATSIESAAQPTLNGGGAASDNSITGVFVKSVLPESAAGRSGLLKVGDRILEVNSVNLREASHERAVDVIRNADSPVVFVLQSLQSAHAITVSVCV